MTEVTPRRRDGCTTLAERAAYAEGLSDAAQRARYLFKHQEFETSDTETAYYASGFEVACEILSSLLEDLSEQAHAAPLLPSTEPASPVRAWDSPGPNWYMYREHTFDTLPEWRLWSERNQ